MRTLTDLHHCLDQHADLAPDGFGLVEQARAGAARIRRRRRIVSAGVGAAAVLLVVAALPAVVQLHLPADQVAAPTYGRTATQLTVEVAPGSGVTLRDVQSVTGRQFASVKVDTPTAGSSAGNHRPGDAPHGRPGGDPLPREVVVYDPGTFDPTVLRRGKPMTVQGQPAWFSRDYPSDASAVLTEDGDYRVLAQTVLGWQDPSGSWVLVSPDISVHQPGKSGITPRIMADVTKVAEAVRIGAPRDIPLPYQLGWLPAGVQVKAVQATPPLDMHTSIQLSGTRAPSAGPPIQLSIDTVPLSANWLQQRDTASRTTVAGHHAWYQPLGDPAAPSTLAVEIGNCGFMINVWRAGISFAEQERLVAAMTVVDCTKPATWIPVVR